MERTLAKPAFPDDFTSPDRVLSYVRGTENYLIETRRRRIRPFEDVFTENLMKEIITHRAQKAKETKVSESSLALDMPFTSCAMAARIALAMAQGNPSNQFFRDLFECIKPLLLHPQTFTASMSSEKDETIKFTNHKNMGYCVVECVPECGQEITETAINFSNFRAEVLDICKSYITDSLRCKKPDEFAMNLEDCVRKFGVTM